MDSNMTGGDQGDSAQIGTDSATSQGATGATEPSIIDVDDNALIRIKGSDKPVKFSDHVRTFQSQATKAAQARAAAEKQLAAERQRAQQYEQQLRQYREQGGNQGGSADIAEQLKSLPYLSGEAAANVVANIQDQLKQRDTVMLAILKKFQEMQGTVGQLHGSHTQASFETKIAGFVADAGLPPEMKEFAKELYMAYEGDDLDAEFPTILRNRIEQMQRHFSGQQAQKIAAAKRAPWVPGKGGATGPSKPWQPKGNESPKDIANQLFESFQRTDT